MPTALKKQSPSVENILNTGTHISQQQDDCLLLNVTGTIHMAAEGQVPTCSTFTYDLFTHPGNVQKIYILAMLNATTRRSVAELLLHLFSFQHRRYL